MSKHRRPERKATMETEHLPAGIVAPLEELARALGAWAVAHPDRPLEELDDAIRGRLDALDLSTGSVPLVALLLIIVIVILLVRD